MRRWRFISWLVIALVILVFSFQFPRVNQTIHAVFYTVTKPFLVVGATVRNVFTDARYSFGKFWNAVAKEREYQAQIKELESQLLRFNEMEKENERLKNLLGFAKTLSFKTIGVQIIGEDNAPWKDIVLLDKGSRKGMKRDRVLVVPEGLVGRVLDTTPFTSRAILLTDPDSRVSAMTANSRSKGVVIGTGSEKLQMKYLALDTEIEIGEDVITSGTGSLFPKGLQIGKIEMVEKDPDGLHLLALIRPSVRFSKLEEILCLVSQASK